MKENKASNNTSQTLQSTGKGKEISNPRGLIERQMELVHGNIKKENISISKWGQLSKDISGNFKMVGTVEATGTLGQAQQEVSVEYNKVTMVVDPVNCERYAQ